MEGVKTKKITILSPFFLSNKIILEELSYWLKVMDRPQGWHYDMDMTWILEKIENLRLKKGSYILDAGAGLGPLQYILAARGYNVCSLDFKQRHIPTEASILFDISDNQSSDFDYTHSYQDFISLDKKSSINYKNLLSPKKIIFFLKNKLTAYILRFIENIKRNKKTYGKIDFVRGAFHQLPFEDNSFDAVVSVSALEHADISLFRENIIQMVRVAKEKSSIMITTSLNNHDKDTFDEQTAGYCFSSSTLAMIDRNIMKTSKDYSSVERQIIDSKIWKSRLDPYYFLNKNSPFYQKKVSKLPYLPIGIYLQK